MLIRSFLMVVFFGLCVFASTYVAFADTTLSRDGEGQKIQGASYVTFRSASIGTKGFKCFSTVSRVAWELKTTNGTDATSLSFKYFFNGDESISYPVSTAFAQWQNSPTSKSPTVTKACVRAYSSAVQKTAHGIFQ